MQLLAEGPCRALVRGLQMASRQGPWRLPGWISGCVSPGLANWDDLHHALQDAYAFERLAHVSGPSRPPKLGFRKALKPSEVVKKVQKWIEIHRNLLHFHVFSCIFIDFPLRQAPGNGCWRSTKWRRSI